VDGAGDRVTGVGGSEEEVDMDMGKGFIDTKQVE
jgi:hypothetical protein